MKNCTKHSIERWVERIVGIITERERDDYIRDNREQIKEHMNKTFEFSDFIYKGKVGDNTERNFYIKDDIIFVLNVTDDAIITVYKVDFNFTKELNLNVAKGLLKEITKLLEEKEMKDSETYSHVEVLIEDNKKIEEQIKILEMQLKILKDNKKANDEYIKNYNSNTKYIDLEIQKYVNNLVNSKEYREDIKAG